MDMEDMITIDQLAELLPWGVSTFRRWRATWPNGECRGPQPLLVEHRLFYSRKSALEWFRLESEKTSNP